MKKLLIVFVLAGACFSLNAERLKVSMWNRLFGDVNKQLRDAISDRDKEGAIKALNAGADPTDRVGGRPAVFMALIEEWADVYELMLDNGLDLHGLTYKAGLDFANMKNEDANLLLVAIRKNFPIKMLQKMIKAGSDPNQVDKHGNAPLFYAKSKDVLEKLFNVGSRLDVQSPDGTTLLGRYILHATPDMIRFLLDNGLDVNAAAKEGMTPLHLTAFLQEPISFLKAKLLIAYGADVNAKTKLGATPLMVAQALGNEPLYEYLLSISK